MNKLGGDCSAIPTLGVGDNPNGYKRGVRALGAVVGEGFYYTVEDVTVGGQVKGTGSAKASPHQFNGTP